MLLTTIQRLYGSDTMTIFSIFLRLIPACRFVCTELMYGVFNNVRGTWKEHRRSKDIGLLVLLRVKLRLNTAKSKFLRATISYAVLAIKADIVRLMPEEVEAIRNFPAP